MIVVLISFIARQWGVTTRSVFTFGNHMAGIANKSLVVGFTSIDNELEAAPWKGTAISRAAPEHFHCFDRYCHLNQPRLCGTTIPRQPSLRPIRMQYGRLSSPSIPARRFGCRSAPTSLSACLSLQWPATEVNSPAAPCLAVILQPQARPFWHIGQREWAALGSGSHGAAPGAGGGGGAEVGGSRIAG